MEWYIKKGGGRPVGYGLKEKERSMWEEYVIVGILILRKPH